MLVVPCRITAACVVGELLILSFSPWEGASANVVIRIGGRDGAAGQRLLGRICRHLGITSLRSANDLAGQVLQLRLAQPDVEPGITAPLLVLEVVA